ncbi:sugar ABC transporter permease [Synergistales bacterium]|nr:sugar ABC transporter permease [Synergistales bacterium]
MKIIAALKKNPMLVALVAVMLLFQVLIMASGKGSLFAPRNITNLIAQNGYVIILATGMLLCILTGGNIDLSVGSMVCLVAAIGGTLIVKMNVDIYLSIAICLAAGIFLGAFQAFWIAYMRIPAFIVTLAGMLAFRGLALVLLQGRTIAPFPQAYTVYFGSFLPAGATPNLKLTVSLITGIVLCAVLLTVESYKRISKIRKKYEVEAYTWMVSRLFIICAVIMGAFYSFGKDRGVPVVLILLGVVVLVYYYYTAKTVPGRYLYAMGGNEKAAKLSGVNTNGMMFFAYTNMGFLAAVAALVCMARFNSSFPDLGRSYELDAIGACFIGGASAYGGVGTVGGTLVGTIFMGVLNNGMSILGIDMNWQQAVKGAVLLSAVAVDVISKKRKTAA